MRSLSRISRVITSDGIAVVLCVSGILMHEWIHLHMHVCACMHMFAYVCGGPRLTLDVCPNCYVPYQRISLSQELTILILMRRVYCLKG